MCLFFVVDLGRVDSGRRCFVFTLKMKMMMTMTTQQRHLSNSNTRIPQMTIKRMMRNKDTTTAIAKIMTSLPTCTSQNIQHIPFTHDPFSIQPGHLDKIDRFKEAMLLEEQHDQVQTYDF
jgi:hypothetical protein